MHKIFYPDSIAIWGLSSKENNIPRLIVENLIRWGFKGRLFGIHPRSTEPHVEGIRIYKQVKDLPIVPDLAVFLLPAKFIPDAVAEAGEFGVRRAVIPSGGFNESGEEGIKLAERLMENIRKYEMRFVGPNGLTVANTANGLCLPFLPIFSPPRGGMSIITQSGGVGVFLWNLLGDENIGMAKFASIGNKLDITEIDCIEYMGNDPETRVICLYLESINNGRALMEAAMKINKPLIIFKANTTNAGNKAAMSHTAAISNNDAITDSAFERAGIVRIDNFSDFIAAAKVFELPPLLGDRLMVMSPAGGFTVMLADLCDKEGFTFADPGEAFFKELETYVNSGVIKISNPLDLGDIYNPKAYADIFNSALHNDNVDGAVFVTQNPQMPKSDDVFYRMFKTDISKEVIGSIRSSNKPFAACLYAPEKTMSKMKRSLSIPVFNSPETMVKILKKQMLFHRKKAEGAFVTPCPPGMDLDKAKVWIQNHPGVTGEVSLELLGMLGIRTLRSAEAGNKSDAVSLAREIGYPVVMKVVSPDAVHKSEAGGVVIGIENDNQAEKAFDQIEKNLKNYKADARFDGVRVMAMAKDGYDMFIGAHVDDSFGPVALFGFGGIWIEVFSDVENVLCPSNRTEIESKVKRLKSYKILQGTRGQGKGDIDAFLDMIERVTHLMAAFPEIKEFDLNPVRVFSDGSGAAALDSRIRIE
ncbi:MAG: acetate--CoA ligase family protein [Desulfobacteraceae bacterium]|jgi:acetyltransferase